MSYQLVRNCYEQGLLTLKDRIIITSGSNLMKTRGTNLIEIYNVHDIIGDRMGGAGAPVRNGRPVDPGRRDGGVPA